MFKLEADCFFKLDESLDEITEDDKCGYIPVKLLQVVTNLWAIWDEQCLAQLVEVLRG